MKKNILLLFLFLFNGCLFSQEELTTELDSLFFNLKIDSSVKEIIRNSKFKTEIYEDNNNYLNEKQKNYVSDFNVNKLIGSPIIDGYFTIIQKYSEIESNEYELCQRIHLKTLKDVIKEYDNLSNKFEKFGFRILESSEEGNSHFSSSENKVISIKKNNRLIVLTFMYGVPLKEEYGYYLFIICKIMKY